jgi:hypothetical protein
MAATSCAAGSSARYGHAACYRATMQSDSETLTDRLLLRLQGSFGQVVEAEDLMTQQLVAIKIVQKKQQYTDQAQTEIDILQQLHVPQQHDATNHIGRCLLLGFRGLFSGRGAPLGCWEVADSLTAVSGLLSVPSEAHGRVHAQGPPVPRVRATRTQPL